MTSPAPRAGVVRDDRAGGADDDDVDDRRPGEPSSTPYRDAAWTYRHAGWIGAIPIPHRTKALRAVGWTGHEGKWPSAADVTAWCESDRRDEGGGNIVLRMPPDVVGIDVDAYAGKTGAADLAAAVHRWGPLPDTWSSTARDDGISAIRFYRVPEGLRWPGQVGHSIEVIQFAHRYAVVWPSLHPEGRVYRWYRPDGMASLAPPRPDELPDMPAAWVAGLTGGELAEQVHLADLTHGQVGGWLATRSGGQECRAMATVTERLLADLAVGSAHESLRRVLGLVRLAEQGHAGLAAALTRVHGAFMAETTNPARAGSARDERQAQAEWARSLSGAVRRALGSPSVADGEQPDDPCASPFSGLVAQGVEFGPPLIPTPSPDAASSMPAAALPAGSSLEQRDDGQEVTDGEMADQDGEAGSGETAAGPDTEERERTSWWPRDLSAVLAGESTEPEPSLLARSDGRCLFYAGKINGLLGESESGKAQPYSAPIATPQGWTTMGELAVGSVILGSDGQPQTVTAVHERGEREVWEIVTGQGVIVEACEEHLWAVTDANGRSRGRPARVLTTRELHDTQRLGSGAPRWRLPMPAPAQYDDPGPLPVDPYLFGLLLGDGGLTKGITFTNPDDELHEQIEARMPLGCRTHAMPNATCRTVSIAGVKGVRNPLLAALRELGAIGCRSIEKSIPEVYQRASIADRLALLHGLMDTDGGIESRAAVFATSSPELAEGVCELVRGLGGSATAHWRQPSYDGPAAPACRVVVNLPLRWNPFRLARKAQQYAEHTTRREPANRIAEVRRTGRSEPMRCIAVSNADRLYRTTGHTLTHNTWILLHAVVQCLAEGLPVLYADFEDTAESVVSRLVALGAKPDTIRDLFDYLAPDETLHQLARSDLGDLLARGYALIGLDGYNAAMTLLGLDLGSNPDVTKFAQSLLRPMAGTGAAVVTVDHVSKDKETRGKGGIGAQAKRAMMTGSAVGVDVLAPFGRGQTGKLKLTVDKDRPGHVRGFAENSKNAGIAILESGSNGSVNVRIDPSGSPAAAAPVRSPWRPTAMMEKVTRFLSVTDGMLSQTQIENGVDGRTVTIRRALELLVEEGYVSRHPGQRNSLLHRYERTFRELDELAGTTAPGFESSSGEGGDENDDREPYPGW